VITKKHKSITAGAFLVLCVFLVSGCTADRKKPETTGGDTARKPVIAVSIIPEETFVKAVCGDLVEIVVMLPPGSNPENYEPSPAEMEKFNSASLYFSIGVPAEENILQNADNIRTVFLHDKVSAVYPDRKFASGGRDPHIWLSPKRVKVMIEVIAEEMFAIDAKHGETYRRNAENYIKLLDALDTEIATAFSGLQNRKIIVYHPAFGYFSDDYRLDMYALEENGKEATAQRLQQMINFAKEEGIRVVFYQEEVDSRQSKAFAEEIHGKTVMLAPLAADYIENLRLMAVAIMEAEYE